MADTTSDHYAGTETGDEIADRILAALRATNGDVPATPEGLEPLDHFNARGAAATAMLAKRLDAHPGEAVLDIGSGIGGPARWIAVRYGCEVTGVDLTPAFCAAARKLNAACGLAKRVTIIDGDAEALPLPDRSFDRAYSHGVIMSVSNKSKFFREAFRVLKPGGRLVLFQHNAGPNGPPEFPVPWASAAEQSFLATDEETRRDLIAAGFEVRSFVDVTLENFAAQTELRARPRAALGMHVLIGGRLRAQRENSYNAIRDGRARMVEIVAIRAPVPRT